MKVYNLVKVHFSFLESQYDFNLIDYRYDYEHFGNEIITYSTNIVGLRIIKDRGEMSIYIGRITDDEKTWFDLCDIIPHYASNYSLIYEFPQELSYEKRLIFQISKLSFFVRMYCEQLLIGDFSAEHDFLIIKENRKIRFIQQISDNKM